MENLFSLVSHVQGSVNYLICLSQVVQGTSEALERAQTGLDAGEFLFDLEQVKTAHLAWMHKLEQMLVGQITLSPDELIDTHDCPFSQWYDNTSQTDLSKSAIFNEIGLVHGNVHHLIQQSVQLIQQKQIEEARKTTIQSNESCDQFFGLLDQILTIQS